MLIGTAVLLASPEPEVPAIAPRTLDEAVLGPLKDFFMRDGAWVMLALIVLYKLGDAFAGSLTTAFLIRGVGFSAAEVGAINKVLGLFATIVGALAGGALMAKLGLFRSLFVFGILQAVSNLVFLALALLPKSYLLMALAVVIENLCGGMGTTAFVALLMALCNVRYSATQFALLSALAAIGRVYVGPVSGQMVAAFGWAPFFFATFVIALPGIALLWWRRETIRALDIAPSRRP
jgi:PAT family beta-lactamase induction signal transducer AmpG